MCFHPLCHDAMNRKSVSSFALFKHQHAFTVQLKVHWKCAEKKFMWKRTICEITSTMWYWKHVPSGEKRLIFQLNPTIFLYGTFPFLLVSSFCICRRQIPVNRSFADFLDNPSTQSLTLDLISCWIVYIISHANSYSQQLLESKIIVSIRMNHQINIPVCPKWSSSWKSNDIPNYQYFVFCAN